MSTSKLPCITGFDIRILKCEFSQEDSFQSDGLRNPLFHPERAATPEYELQQQLQWMQDEMDAYANGPDQPQLGKGPSVHIGIDSEWQYDAARNANRVLSYQYHLFSPQGELAGIIYPKASDPDRRIEFNRFLGLILQQAMQQDLIEAWPKGIFVYAHFLRADLTHFQSFWKMKNSLDGLRGTIASVQGDLAVDYEAQGRRYKPAPLELRDEHRHPRRTLVRFIDTMLLTPGGLGLDAAGELIGIAKQELPEGQDKANMARFLAECPDEFEAYAIRDAEIAVRYGLRINAFVREEMALKRLPPTIGSLAARLCRQLLETEHGSTEGFQRVFGLENHQRLTYWHEQRKRPHQVDGVQLSPYRERHEAFVTRCYHGGRNECFMPGPSELSDYHDYDLVGAYTTGLIDLRELDYAQAFDSLRIENFLGHVCGFVRVDFKFPLDTRFPCLPVYSESRGLYYPRAGTSDCTAPEIALAHALGADLRIQIGLIIPWKASDARIFEPFVTRVRQRRLHYKGLQQSFEEKLWKEIGNSVYGKTAQGLREKSVFDPRTGRGKTLPSSALTNPFFAAHTTGFIRAVVSELIARVPEHRVVISVTTDGFLTDATLDELDLSGPLSSRFQALLNRLDGQQPEETASMLERKHRVQQLIAMKTRGQLTAELYPGEAPVLAKASVKPPLADKTQHNDYMLDLYLKRQPGQQHSADHLISLREQWTTESDLVALQHTQRLNLEFDFKRQLVNPRMVPVRGGEHLACDTVPWATAAQAELARALFDGWCRTHCLKTVADFESWQEFYVLRQLTRHSGISITAEGTVGLLRAYTQNAWGICKTMTYSELADWLTAKGYPTTVAEVKNAGRAKLVEGVVPMTPRVQALLLVLQEVQPGLEVDRIFAPSLE